MCLFWQIWQLRVLNNGGVSVEALSDLTRHTRAVNAVRFSPSGEFLASADDGKGPWFCMTSTISVCDIPFRP